MANPQPAPFVKFSKELFDALLLSRMPATHKELVLAVIRRTYGDHGRKEAPISQSLLQQMTARSRNGVRKSIDDLQREGVIVQVSPPSFAAPAVLKLNKDYESWGKWSVERATVVGEGQEVPQDNESGGGQGHSDGPGEGHCGGGGEGHCGGPIEDIETLEDIETPPEAAKPRGDALVAYYVDRHAELGRTKPDRRRIGMMASQIAEQRGLGAPPDVLREAVRRIVDEAKSPSMLGLKVGDVERERMGTTGKAQMAMAGRSQHGEF